MKALVVDDSRVMRLILKKALTEKGFDVVQAGNGREALEVLEQNPDAGLVMLDFNMPEMDGVSLVKEIRADDRYSEVKLVMVTSQTEAERISTALLAGADEYIMKPFTNEIIYEKLELLGVIE